MKKSEINFKRVNLKLNKDVHHLMTVHCAERKESIQDFVEKAVLYFLSIRLEKEKVKKIVSNFENVDFL